MLRRRLILIEVTCDNWPRVHQGSNLPGAGQWPFLKDSFQSPHIFLHCTWYTPSLTQTLDLCFRFWKTYLKTCQHVVSGWVNRQPRRCSGTSFSEIKVLPWLWSTVPWQLGDGRAARFGPPWILTPLLLLRFKRFSAQLWPCSSSWTKTKPYQVIQNNNEAKKAKQK